MKRNSAILIRKCKWNFIVACFAAAAAAGVIATATDVVHVSDTAAVLSIVIIMIIMIMMKTRQLQLSKDSYKHLYPWHLTQWGKPLIYL